MRPDVIEQKWLPRCELSVISSILTLVFSMTTLKNPKSTADDLEAEAERAFQRAANQQNRNEDDFDSEFEGAFQNPSPNEVATKTDSAIGRVSTRHPDVSNGPTQLPVKTEGLPSSLPSSQG